MVDQSVGDSPVEMGVEKLQKRLTEAVDSLWDSFVDPREAYTDADGSWWRPLATGTQSFGQLGNSFDETSLGTLRDECRQLAMANEYAINGHENRISYIVGSGHRYQVTVRRGVDLPEEVVQRAQQEVDDFLQTNRWQLRQQEIVRRMDRDGEAFLRFFVQDSGRTFVRFVEPDQVATPKERSTDHAASFGILAEPRDVESVQGYYVDGVLVDADEIQHRKSNVDANVKRGLPLYTAVRKNLRRAEKLLRNMSVVAEIQSAIALIRKHRSASRTGVEQFVANQSSATPTGPTRLTQYGPGTILDAPAGLEYDFPTTGIDAASYVKILQAELRAIAARLVMPEFMFTSDASNSSYASTMVAEGPAVRMFERLQASLMQDDRDVIWRVLENAAAVGRVPVAIRDLVDIQITAPSLHVRDPLQQAGVDRIAYEHGVLSSQTWSQRLGLDYDQEQKNIERHALETSTETTDS